MCIRDSGIGNDFADYLEMSSDYKKAVDCIINNRRRKIDVGTCYYDDGEKHLTRYFLNAINRGPVSYTHLVAVCCNRLIIGIYTDNELLTEQAFIPFVVTLLNYTFALPGYVYPVSYTHLCGFRLP